MSNLVELVARARADLRDGGGEIWSDAEIAAHLRRALHEYSMVAPATATATLEAVEGQRVYSLATLSGLLHVMDVWYPYNPTAPQHPPHRPPWTMLPGNRLYLQVDRIVAGEGALIAVHHARSHTLQGLDGALITTPDGYGQEVVVWGATAHAAMQMARDAIGRVTVSGWTPQQWREWAAARADAFHRALETLRHRAVLVPDARVAPLNGEV
jgi:hypothetical protein